MGKNQEFDAMAIDPLALILSGPAYVRIIEKLHPHVPKILQEIARSMTAEERELTLNRARALESVANQVQAALGSLVHK